MGFLNYSVSMQEPGQVVGDLDTNKLEALDHFYFVPIVVDRGMSSTMLPEVGDYLFFYRNPTVQKEAIRPIESAPTTIPPRPYPISLHIYPLIALTYASQDTKGNFSMANQPNPHIFGLWEETGAPGRYPRRHEENVQTPHRQ